jgi:hypothetical protein
MTDVDPETRAEIDRLIREERFQRIPAGVRAAPEPRRTQAPMRAHAEGCGSGRPVPRRRALHELDGDEE